MSKLRIRSNHQLFEAVGQKDGSKQMLEWESQLHGISVRPSKQITVDEVEDKMKQVMGVPHEEYNLLHHNCHIAQESTRRAFGWM